MPYFPKRVREVASESRKERQSARGATLCASELANASARASERERAHTRATESEGGGVGGEGWREGVRERGGERERERGREGERERGRQGERERGREGERERGREGESERGRVSESENRLERERTRAETDALRGSPVKSDISPKKSPVLRDAIFTTIGVASVDKDLQS
jgi:hypothetical protein